MKNKETKKLKCSECDNDAISNEVQLCRDCLNKIFEDEENE